MSDKYEIRGTIKLIDETQQVTDKFKKRSFVIVTDDEKYPQPIALEFTQDNCGKLDGFSVGDQATVSFNLRGSEYKGRYFVNLSAWKIEAGVGASSEPF